jgi:RNA polymerase-binding protein DksA
VNKIALSIEQDAKLTHHSNRRTIVRDYADVKKKLLEMLEELDERVAKITDHVKHVDEPIEKDFAEQATQAENNEVMDYLGNAAQMEIIQIKQALTRIDSGNYGLCEVCGEGIREERLQAMPYASMCIKCASQTGC